MRRVNAHADSIPSFLVDFPKTTGSAVVPSHVLLQRWVVNYFVSLPILFLFFVGLSLTRSLLSSRPMTTTTERPPRAVQGLPHVRRLTSSRLQAGRASVLGRTSCRLSSKSVCSIPGFAVHWLTAVLLLFLFSIRVTLGPS